MTEADRLSLRSHRPGDVFLDRYMPDASEEEREAARANLQEFAVVVLRIHTRLAREDLDEATRVSRDHELQ